MNIERFAWKLAFVWICFRMLADMIGRTLRGLLKFLEELFALVVSVAWVGLIAWGIWWFWQRFAPVL